MSNKLNREQILSIPILIGGGKSIGEVAVELGVSSSAIDYQIRRLKNSGIEVPTKRGARPLKLV